MKIQRIFLGEGAELDIYLADPVGNYLRKGLLVIPGGGYGGVCADREGEPIGLAFMPYGFNVFVLHYSVRSSGRVFPIQLIQASRAMKYIKNHAQDWQMDGEKIFVTGSSAGGHLAASLGTMWHLPQVYEAVEMPYGYNKPAGMILSYPVVTGMYDWCHEGSVQNAFCTDEPTQEQRRAFSIELHVDEKSCPMFLMHTSDDQTVDIRHALVLAESYRKAGLPFELHVYPSAPHGIALANKITAGNNPAHDNARIADWVAQAAGWADEI